MAKEEDLKKVELKVSVDCCDGCKKKVLRALSIQEIHLNLPKVTVVGNVDKEMLVKRLVKFGKVAEVISPPDTNKGQQQQPQQQQPQQQEESKKPNSDNMSTKCIEEGEKVKKCLNTSNKITNNANSTTASTTTTTTTISAMATTALPHITYTMNPAAVHEVVMQQHGVHPVNWYPGNPNPWVIPTASFVHGAYQTPVAQPYCTSGCCYHRPSPVRSLPPRLTEYYNDDNATGCHVM